MQENKSENFNELKKLRDTLKLRSHLFRGEVQDLWKQAEDKMHEYESKLKNLKENTKESKEGLGSALELLKEEIGETYNRIKSSI